MPHKRTTIRLLSCLLLAATAHATTYYVLSGNKLPIVNTFQRSSSGNGILKITVVAAPNSLPINTHTYLPLSRGGEDTYARNSRLAVLPGSAVDGVLGAVGNPQILAPVIQSVSIDVIDHFSGPEFVPQQTHNKPVHGRLPQEARPAGVASSPALALVEMPVVFTDFACDMVFNTSVVILAKGYVCD